MSSFILLPGAGGAAWYWSRVAPRLRAEGHAAVAVDLPGPDPHAGLPEYVELTVAAAAGADEVVLVAQSMGSFTAVPACERLPVRRLVLFNAMIPAPRETAETWGDATGSEAARVAAARAGGYPDTLDLETTFFHDMPPDAVAEAALHERDEADIAFDQPCPFDAWPEVPTTVLCGRDDRLFPLAFQRRVTRERLGLDVEALPGGHMNALSEPGAAAAALLRLA